MQDPQDIEHSGPPQKTVGRRKHALIGGLWLAASQVVPILGTAVLSIVAGRKLGAERLGTQSLIAFVESLVFSIIVQSLTSAAVRSLAAAEGGGNKSSLAKLNWWTLCAHYIAGIISASLLALFGFLRQDGELSWYLASVSVFATAAGWAHGAVIVAASGWADVGRERLVSQLLAALLAIGAVLAGGGIEWIFIANIMASVWVAGRLGYKARSLPTETGWRAPPGLWPIYGMLVSTEVVNQVVARRSEFFVLDKYSTESDIAMYSVAFMLVTTLVMIPQSLGQAIMPVIARAAGAMQHELLHRHLSHALRITALLSIPLTAYAVACGPDAVKALYGDEFSAAGTLTAWSALIVLALPTWRLCADYLSGVANMRPLLITGLVGGAVDLGAAFLLIPQWGAGGAVAAKILGQGIMSGLLIAYVQRSLGRIAIFTSGWWTMSLLSLVGGSCGWLVASSVSPWPGMILGAIVVTVVLAIGSVIFRPISAGDADWLCGLVPGRLKAVVRAFSATAPRHDAPTTSDIR